MSAPPGPTYKCSPYVRVLCSMLCRTAASHTETIAALLLDGLLHQGMGVPRRLSRLVSQTVMPRRSCQTLCPRLAQRQCGNGVAVMHSCQTGEGKQYCLCCQGALMRRSQETGALTTSRYKRAAMHAQAQSLTSTGQYVRSLCTKPHMSTLALLGNTPSWTSGLSAPGASLAGARTWPPSKGRSLPMPHIRPCSGTAAWKTRAPSAYRSHVGHGQNGQRGAVRPRTHRIRLGSRPYGLPGPRAWKPAMWPRQKGHSGAARPRAHSWYAHARQSACPHAPTAT